MYRFIWRPAWLLSHIAILGLIVTMVLLGFWQLRRLDYKRALHATIEERTAAPPVPMSESLRSEGESDFVPVSAVGHYLPDLEFVILSRSMDGAPGRWVVTPFQTDSGLRMAVLRGFLTIQVDDVDMPIEQVAAPSGEVALRGWVRKPETKGSKSPLIDPRQYQWLDVPKIGEDIGIDLGSNWLQLYDERPQQSNPLLRPVPLPEVDDGPHLSYAVQWFTFSAIGVIGYPLIIRKVARQRATGALEEGADGIA